MRRDVVVPFDKKAAIERICSENGEISAAVLSQVIGNWMLSEAPMFSKREILRLLDGLSDAVVIDALVDRMCHCGSYNDYEKFFDLLDAFERRRIEGVLINVIRSMRTRQQQNFELKCQRMLENICCY